MIARMDHPALITLSEAEESMVLGESYEEAAGLVETVLAAAATRCDGNVVCVLDQNMDYPGRARQPEEVPRGRGQRPSEQGRQTGQAQRATYWGFTPESSGWGSARRNELATWHAPPGSPLLRAAQPCGTA